MRVESEIVAHWKYDEAKPVVSILCITYNQIQYIEDALKGFLIQETTSPFEIIVHDDASTDGTQRILEKYEENYPRIIKIIKQTENQYQRKINIIQQNMIPCAKGEFIALCEGDDYWTDPNKLEAQIKVLRQNDDIAICIHNADVRNCTNNSTYDFNAAEIPEYLSTKDVVTRGWFAPTASYLLRSYILRTEHAKEMARDIEILALCSLHGNIYYDKRKMSVYRYMAVGSLSEATVNKLNELIKHKLVFLRKVDKMTGRKLIFYTTLARIRLIRQYVRYFYNKIMGFT